MKRTFLAAVLCLQASSALAKGEYEDALEEARAGHPERAIETLQALTAHHPNRLKYRYDYLQVLLWANRDDDVLKESERIELEKAPAYVLETIAKASRNLKQFERAAALYRQAARKAPRRLTPLIGIGMLMLDTQQTDSALAHFETLYQKFPNDAEILVGLATAQQQAGQLENAEHTFKQALSHNPDHADAIAGLVRTQTARQNYSGALDTANLHREMLSDEQLAALRWDRASWLIRKSNESLDSNPNDFVATDRAIAAVLDNLQTLDQLSLEHPNDWRAQAESDLLMLMSKRGRPHDVAARFERLKPQNLPLSEDAKAVAASAYLSLGQVEHARDLTREILQHVPENTGALRVLANAYLQLGDKQALDDVLQTFSALTVKYPNNKNLLYDYIQLLQWSGNNNAALTRAENVDINSAPVYLLETIAKAAREQGDFVRSDRLYTLASERAPHRLPPRIARGLLLLDQHKAAAASQYFDALAAQHPDDRDTLFARAQAHDMAGHRQQASELYRRLIAQQPGNTDAVLGLIKNLMASGQLSRALQAANQYRETFSDDLWADLNWKYAASLIRQGEAALQQNADDFQRIDQAIEAIGLNLDRLDDLQLKEPEVWRARAHADLLIALRDRKQYDLVDSQYRDTQANNIKLPAYALLAVADSYIQNQQNVDAVNTYLALLNQEPNNLDGMIGLIRLYLDTQQRDAIEPVLRRLADCAERYPRQPRYRYDLIKTLSWLDRDAEVLTNVDKIDSRKAPPYVLEAIARAARNQHDFNTAERFFQYWAERLPDQLEPRLNLARVMLDRKQANAAIEFLQTLRQDHPKHIEIERLLADAHNMNGNPEQAIVHYQNMLALDSSHTDAIRGLTFSLAKTNQAPSAVTLAAAHRAIFSDDEWASIQWSHAAWMIREGERALANDGRDYRMIDQAIIALNENLASLASLNLRAPADWQYRAQFDLMVALRDRRRLNETIALYEALKDQPVALPVYARIAAGDAYLNNRQPEQARDIYQDVLADIPQHLQTKISLAYAYLESEQPERALQTARQLSADEPETLLEPNPEGGQHIVTNPQKATADMIAAVFRAYTDDLDGAQFELENLRRRYPDNIDIRNKLAEIYYYRGWPRKARNEITDAQRQAPGHIGLKLNEARVAHELRDYPTEAKRTYELYSYYPEDSGALRQMNAWKRHNKPELKLYATGSSSYNEPTNNNDFVASDDAGIEGFLYTAPIEKNFRLFTHDGWRTGAFREGRGYLRHFGAGVEYAEKDVLATAEVHYDNFASDAVGVDLGVDYRVDDHWQLFSRISSLDNNISLRALTSGVTAQSARFGAIYQVNESRSFRLASGYTHFSDDNNRFGVDGQYFERWISGPIYKMGTYLNAGYSTNQHQEGAYFSPKQDVIASITLDNDWLTYRHYETDFHQRLSLTLGGYWQQDFGVNPVGNVQYEHRWHLGRDVELSYGGGRSYRYYDDALTETWQLFLAADIRF